MMRIASLLITLILSCSLTMAQPTQHSNDSPLATTPQPASGGFVTKTWTTLSWQPGHSVQWHELYLSDDFNDVNDSLVEPIVIADPFQVVGSLNTPFPSGLTADTTYYWRIDEVNEINPDSPVSGDIWEFKVAPLTAWYPQPVDSGELILGTWEIELTWRSGLGGSVHSTYFGEDFNDVNNAPPGTGKVMMNTRMDPGPLDLNRTYFWRVDEYDAGNRVFRRGPVWRFDTTQWRVVDDFEQYADKDPNWIWLAWEDGFEVNGTGGLAGHLSGHNKAYTYETAIVHSGGKSLPMYYDNSGRPDYPTEDDYGTRLMYSEVTLPFDPPANWTKQTGLDTNGLVLWYRGLEDNAPETVSVVIVDSSGKSAVVPGSPDMLHSTQWKPWHIDLSELTAEINLARISSLSIRIGAAQGTAPGGSGLLYLDDIGLLVE